MSDKKIIVMNQTTTESLLSDVFTGFVCILLMWIAEAEASNWWQITTIGMFVFFIISKLDITKEGVKRFHTYEGLADWAKGKANE